MRIEEGCVVAGRYRLERALARGGMGSVWVARHTQLDVLLAIKFMDPTFAASADARNRFEREAKAAAKLQSPHVVQVTDYGVDDETPFIVMELLIGEDLGDRLKRERRLSLKATSDIVTQTAKALRRAHDERIVHRDLKPGNIFLSKKQDDDEIIKVLDFGIAKARMSTEDEATKTGTLIGSPHYMSPEQARGGKNLDHRSDLWSLAVIIFRAITGHLPFPGEEIGEVILAICAEPVPIPSQVAPDLGPAVDQFFTRALARDVTKRFQSAKELAEAFANLAGSSLVGSSLLTYNPALVQAANVAIELPSEDLKTEFDDGSLTGRAPSFPPGRAPSFPPGGPFGSIPAPPGMPTGMPMGPSMRPGAADPLSPSGSLAPAGSTFVGTPKSSNRTAVIAAVAFTALVAVGAIGFVVTRAGAQGPTVAQTGAVTPTPTVKATTAPTPTVTATAAVAAATATDTAAVAVPTATAAATAPTAKATAATVSASTPVVLGKGKLPPAKKEGDGKKQSGGGNSLLGF